jgi:lysozyme
MSMHAPPVVLAAPLTKACEGLFLRPYLCPAKVPSIGFGATHYEDGVRVQLSDAPITPARAESLLYHELDALLPRVYALCPRLRDWGESPTAAILDFAFNLGAGRLAASTLRRRIAADDRDGARSELMKWVYGGGRVLPGLVRRRVAEAAQLAVSPASAARAL